MAKIIHPIAGVLALMLILTFWLSTAISETLGGQAAIIAVKTAIPWGFLLLVPALMATGATGFAISKNARIGLAAKKLKRMPIIGANGVLILIPCALFLSAKASAGEFDTSFYAVQALELVAGLVNITLLSLNMRDGFKLSGRFRRAPPPRA